MPRITPSKRKQLASGFGKPFSRCNDRIAARSTLIEDALIVFDKCDSNSIKVHSDAGRGDQSGVLTDSSDKTLETCVERSCMYNE